MSGIPTGKRLAASFAAHNLRAWGTGGLLRRLPVAPAVQHPVPGDFFGICVAAGDDPASVGYVLDRLRDLNVRNVRVDFSPTSANTPAKTLLKALAAEGYRICLHLVQPFEEAALMPSPAAVSRWRSFVSDMLDSHRNGLDAIEIGSTCNRRRWTGYSPEGFLAAWAAAHGEARRRGVTLAGPNVTDFEPVYNAGLLGILRDMRMLPDIHTNNLFAERATEPEAFDPKILGRGMAGIAKCNTVRKAVLLSRIGALYGVTRTWSTHVAWSLRRINRILPDTEDKQADYCARYLCLLAAAGAPDRIYWGPLISQREGLIDDGTMEYPDVPHVTFYGRVPGSPRRYRIRPAFHSMRAAVLFTAGATYDRSPSSGNGLEIHCFRKDGRVIHVVWTTNGLCAPAQRCYTPEALRNASVYSRDGEALDSAPPSFGESPVYLVWPQDDAPEVMPTAAVVKALRVWPAADVRFTCRTTPEGLFVCAGSGNGPDPDLTREALESAAGRVMRDRRNKVIETEHPSDPTRRIVVKTVRIRAGHKRFMQRWRVGRALKSWNGAAELLRRGVNTARPVALWQPADTLTNGLFATEFFDSQGSVREALDGFKKGRTEYLGLAPIEVHRALARFLGNMHGRGVYFRDLSAGNILMRVENGRPVFCLIDTARARFHTHAVSPRCRLRDLRRVLHPLNWKGRRLFLAAYANENMVRFGPAFFMPFVRYDLKHFLKDRLRGKKRWIPRRWIRRITGKPPRPPAHGSRQ
ncbi:MAG: hypothetical protein FJ224_04955 [Lentisphaerae bacterium]|nr:hypothetical protein [Lentisphaerota bacterium]